MRLISQCPSCKKKNVTETTSFKIGQTNFITLSCTHVISEKLVQIIDKETITLKDGRKLYPYQVEGVKFLEAANGRALINDDTGLGKTIQYIAFAMQHPETLPVVIVVKASLTVQWQREIYNGAEIFAQILETKSKPLPVGAYIVSYDTLARKPAWLEKLNYKSVVLDECQAIKNHEAKRTQRVRDVVRDKQQVMMLSATPIKNNAGEYFPALNILSPRHFYSQRDYIYRHVQYVWDGYRYKLGGLSSPENFKAITKDFIIRRTRNEVLPDLPKIQRIHKFYPLGDDIQRQYDAKLQEMYENLNEDEIESMSSTVGSSLLKYLAQMRHITGFAKIDPTVDYIEELIDSANGTGCKVTVFLHHIDVGDKLEIALQEKLNVKPLRIKSEHSAEERQATIDKFKDDPDAQVMIAPTLAAGEGINLQFCDEAVIMEREWNPSNEEQAEGRFPRIGSEAQSIQIFYPTAIGSPDEYLTEIVERKRTYMASTLDGKITAWDQSSIVKEMGMKLLEMGRKRWRDKVKV